MKKRKGWKFRVVRPVKKSKREKVQSCARERGDTRPSSFGERERGRSRLIIKMHSTEL